MKGGSKAVAYSALAAALGTLLLLIASVLPGGKLVLLCVASLAVTLIECLFGWKWALGTYAVTALLSLLLLPAKAMAILYTVFFGYYPLIMALTERIRNVSLRFALRLALFNAVLTLLYLVFGELFSLQASLQFGFLSGYPVVLILLMNLAFLIYDAALRQGMLYCFRNITRRIK